VAAVYFLVSLRLRPGKEESVYAEGRGPQPALAPAGEDAHDPGTTSGPGDPA
jgi:hypothetical protein